MHRFLREIAIPLYRVFLFWWLLYTRSTPIGGGERQEPGVVREEGVSGGWRRSVRLAPSAPAGFSVPRASGEAHSGGGLGNARAGRNAERGGGAEPAELWR